MKGIVFLSFVLVACGSPNEESDTDFIKRGLSKFPQAGFYQKWNWKLDGGYILDDGTRLTLTYENGDTSIFATLQRDSLENTISYRRELQILLTDGERKERFLVVNEFDTAYRFSMPKDFQFTFEPGDTNAFTFISGKHRYFYEQLYYDSCQSEFYREKKDSLSRVKGDVPRLKRCEDYQGK